MQIRTGRIARAGLLVAAAALVFRCRAETVDDIVAAVSQANYTNHLRNRLYTTAGSNRFAAVLGPEHDAARDYIAGQFRALGLETTLDNFSWFRNKQPYQGTLVGTNVVAKLTGTVHPEKQFILGAHYDSAVNPGADDDASGVAGLLEAARVLSSHKFEYTILFIAFDFEEIACSGSASYIDRHLNDQILGMVEMDMIAYNDQGRNLAEVWSGGPDDNPVSKALLAAMKRYAGTLATAYRGWEGASDHGPIAAAGFNTAMLSEAEPYSPYYHKPSDTTADERGLDTLTSDGSLYIDYTYATTMLRGAVGWLADSAVLTGEAPAVPSPRDGRTVRNNPARQVPRRSVHGSK
jgi:hypothetical protein